MNQQEILKKIGGIIAELKDQYSYLENADGELNQLELELFKANATFLTDHVEILKKITSQQTSGASSKQSSPAKTADYEARTAAPDYFKDEDFEDLNSEAGVNTSAESNVDEIINKPESGAAFITKTLESYQTESSDNMSDQAQKEPVKEASVTERQSAGREEINMDFKHSNAIDNKDDENLQLNAAEPIDEQPSKQETPQTDSFVRDREMPPQIEAPVQPQISFQPEVETTESFNISKGADEIEIPLRTTSDQEPALTLNQQLAAQNSKVHPNTKVVNPSNGTPDLQALISLNDKLLFVKELFNGYNLAYAEAINILNRYTSFEESEKFLKINYADKNSWQEKPAPAERFYELLRKRFGA